MGYEYIYYQNQSFAFNLNISRVQDKELLKTVLNHPVHILTEKGEFSPSSFIPFCFFGGKFIGAKSKEFDLSLCDIFKPRIYLDQLCYETNLQELKHSKSQKIGKQFEIGLTLVLDCNEERQSYNTISKNGSNAMKVLYHNDNDISIYLDAIS